LDFTVTRDGVASVSAGNIYSLLATSDCGVAMRRPLREPTLRAALVCLGEAATLLEMIGSGYLTVAQGRYRALRKARSIRNLLTRAGWRNGHTAP
jgi:hypothetical protein